MKGFKNPYEEDAAVFDQEWNDFEAGGQEAVRCLKEEGVRYETLDCTFEYKGIVVVPKHSKGYLVFIEEE